MFERKDAVPALFLLLLIFAIIVTLSQILVVHQHNHRNLRPKRDAKKFQAMMNQLDKTIDTMMKSDVLTQEKYENDLMAQIYAARVRKMFNNLYRTSRKHSAVVKPPESIDENVNDNFKAKDRKTRVLHNTYNKQKLHITDTTKPTEKHYESSENIQVTQNMETYIAPSNPIKSFISKKIGLRKESLIYPGDVWDIMSNGEKLKSKSTVDTKHAKTNRNTLNPKEPCSDYPPALVGPLRFGEDVLELARLHKLRTRDRSSPKGCIARHHVAIVIPYRDRKRHLDTLLYNLIPILQRQQLDFRVFVVEQHGNETFNKGRLMNAGFIEAWKIGDFHCFIFHDVDLIPENDQNMYTCPPDNPRHMSVAVDKFNYSLPYQKLVGGVFSISRKHFLQVNGYSNLYWGWGAEDDDMALRLREVGLSITRPPPNVARYRMIKHSDREKIPYQWTYYLLRTLRKRFRKDGLNSLSYKTMAITDHGTYTHMLVDVGEAPKKLMKL